MRRDPLTDVERSAGVPSVDDVAVELGWISVDPDPDGLDVRLQVHGGSWTLWSGLPCYDDDHRGGWGASVLPIPCSPQDRIDCATDLIEQVREDLATMLEENQR